MIYENQRHPSGCCGPLGLIVAVCVCFVGEAMGQGVFALQPGSHDPRKLDPPRGNRLVYAADLNTPGIDGLTIRYRRSWPPQFIDQCRARVTQAGDRWTLLVCTEPQTWYSPSFLSGWESLIAELGAKYAADQSLWGVHLTGVGSASEERHYKVTPTLEAADKQLIAAWARAFPGKKLLFAIGAKDDAGMKRLIQYAMAIAPGRVVVKSNAMKSGTNLNAPHNQLIVWAGKQGASIGFEMAAADSNWPKVKQNIAAIERQAGRQIVYLAPYPTDLVQAGGK